MNREKTDGKREKLHILQVHNYYTIPGGEDQVVKSEGELLREHGHKVWLYERKNKELSRMSGRKKLCLPFTTVFSLKTYREVKRLIREQKIDLVHVHNTLPLISPSVFYAAFASGVPAVMSVHNFRLLCPGALFYREGRICEECVEKGLYRSIKYGCYRGSRLQTLLCAASIKLHRMAGTYQRIYFICLTEFNKKKLLRLKGICPERIFVKANFAEAGGETVFPKQREDYFFYGGRLEEEKGIKVLMKAFLGLEDEKLVICGEGSLTDWCGDYTKKHAMKNVTLKGAVSGEEVKKLMSRAKGVIIPSLWYEGFPMIMAEAYSVRTPVIGSDVGNVGQLIKEHGGGWTFETGNAEALAEAVKICNREQESIPVTEGGMSKGDWSKEGNYKRLIQIYRRCIADVRKAQKKRAAGNEIKNVADEF